ncbi:hypothetical protein [Clostridium folliculivorans]|uniref:Uncharacterized protein n=1 Tax=Clostridium folliculivorans TaxID=2886038 RepID=A0A9W5Y4V7_9CLOT|nr:hypothetical protein [Clostridium folliculivorans]GKU26570.1 hypothetical protein CFOLD11_33970 [Clostridium folliculivorans]GKU28998.1 hypothetical protein CFB3_11040 [Clostridium folliculivorans]
MFNIALVEDDITISEGINYALKKKGYGCHRFYDGDNFLEKVSNRIITQQLPSPK